jgi:hypothetical protein
LTQDSKLVHKKKGVAAVQEKAVELTTKQRLGQFKSDREKDVLSGALSIAEHTRRICGVASQMPWKVGFSKDVWSYKKQDRYKKNIEDAIEEKMNAMYETKFRAFMDNFSQGRQLAELEQVTQTPPPPPPLSSIGSIAALHTWYLVDDITGDTSCRLHIPLGRVGNKTKEVAIGVAMPGRVFHNNPIPAEYAKVLVNEITNKAYIDYPLDHVTPERVKELEEAVNEFILWNQHEIVLDGPATLKDREASLLMSQKDKEASPLTKSHPPVQRFNETSLPLSPKEKEASPLPETNPPPEQDLPRPSPYKRIDQDLGLYEPITRSDPTEKFFEVIKKQKMSTMSAPTQHSKSYLTASEIGSYEEDGEFYDWEKLELRPNDLIFMKDDVPENFEFGKPFLTSAELSRRHFPFRRLHNWYMTVSSLGVTNITFQIPGNAFYSGARIGSIEWEDLWLVFHQKWLDLNLLVVWCL